MRYAAALALVVLALIGLAAGTLGSEPSRPIERLRDDAFVPVPTPSLPAIVETTATTAPTHPAVPPVPTPRLVVVVTPTGSVPPPPRASVASIVGLASWYCEAGVSICMAIHPDTVGFDAYAAAGPGLRAAICGTQACTGWRDRAVTVCGRVCVAVRLADWCQCYAGQSSEKLIDLYHDVFVLTGGSVSISW